MPSTMSLFVAVAICSVIGVPTIMTGFLLADDLGEKKPWLPRAMRWTGGVAGLLALGCVTMLLFLFLGPNVGWY